MLKIGLAAAAVVAVVIGGGALLGAFRSAAGPGARITVTRPYADGDARPDVVAFPNTGAPGISRIIRARALRSPAGTTYQAVAFQPADDADRARRDR